MTCASHLATVLCDATSFAYRAHAAHWNVTGDDFPAWHEFFGELYDDVHDSLDTVAENIRKLGAFPPSSLDELIAGREIGAPKGAVSDAQDLLKELIALNDGLLKCLNEAFAAATRENQQGIANFLADRIDQHQKWRWQMTASLEDDAKDAEEHKPAPRRKPAPRSNPALKKVAPLTARPPKVK